MTKLSLETWKDIFRNVGELTEEEYYDEHLNWVEILHLDGTDEWILCYGEQLFEDDFKTEEEAAERLEYLENELIEWRDVGVIVLKDGGTAK